MRVKTDERRKAIMEGATSLFQEHGFERTSMSAIAAKIGFSKATLYSYFASKEELFASVMHASLDEQADRMLALLDPDGADIKASLRAFSQAYVDLILTPELLSLARLGITQGNSELGPAMYKDGPLRGWLDIIAVLENWSKAGKIRIENPQLAGFQLKGLLEAGLLEARLFGAEINVPRETVIQSAVDMFLLCYPLQDTTSHA